ncbi:NADH ubiquinone oxidoreductase chain A [Arcticibacter svalbardensis MN12-7]|uniref:NADH-quinone oxidoreductase subunit A n=1 Tax=Arcticibacter svalbardensis MN12-7 TaxID=1150600 RepID=R9GTS8_9SPHI|nr:NADH-quinone oxidoreductase subunit A [Arcticibacter svalbardensis]EOR95088.1 NADH ubiquinone oxidoreductase chain A [Arcticibacter svalbardensis MN12-7]
MEEVSQLTEFGKVFIILLTGLLLVSVTILLSNFLAPFKPNPTKLSSYECGEEPTGNAWIQVNTRFYVIALVFLLFEVEMIFIFPWSTVFGQKELILADHAWGWLTLIEMFIFVGVLLLGLVYVWMRKDLNWIKPNPILTVIDTGIPMSAYDRINSEIYKVKAFSMDSPPLMAEKEITQPTVKPAFKPAFKRTQK